MLRTVLVSSVMSAVLLMAACGGDSDNDENGLPFGGGDDADSTATQAPASGDESQSLGEPGELTLTTDPAQGVVEVDGETVTFGWDEARFKSCEITETNITIEFMIDDGRRLSINGGEIPDVGWGVYAYVSLADSGEFQYELVFPRDSDSFGLGETAVSLEGGASYMEGFARVDDNLRPMTIAVNCEDTEE